MKKLKLKAMELGTTEVLTRAQLKNVLGGVQALSTNPGCLHRDWLCSPVTEETDCCGSGRCLYNGNAQTGYVCM
ncbi:hypothetical protein [Mucilaginibacter sp. OK098]|uniref:hypothetical protein n=1 Tax=Mucilaginibacter sp. OK098 TaxID=1855297 RepID=UPI000914A3FF|nr:hypothetical protein [Mucilaginibacter sp. OK098]SHM81818.1 hypothetical protein SAMN05216524_103529 [Mucilaginibacter sp. OK098]